MAREDKAKEGKARQGKARQDKARQGNARQGKARRGKPRKGRESKVRPKGKKTHLMFITNARLNVIFSQNVSLTRFAPKIVTLNLY